MSYRRRPAAVARAAELLATMRKRPVEGLDALDSYLLTTHGDLTAREQAAALGTSLGNLHYWRKALYGRGILDSSLRASHAPITDAEAAAIARLWCDGWSRAAIAAAREINESRVTRALLRAGVTGATPRRTTLLTADVCRIFGANTENVRYWRRAGWLPDARPLHRPGSRHNWDYDDLVAFVRTRASWVAWTPTQITDPHLRHLAEHERAAADGTWQQLGEVARILGVSASNLSLWRSAHGVFCELPVQPWAGAQYIWLTHPQLAELEAWGAEVRRHRPGSDRHRWAANALKQRLIAAYGRSEPAEVVA